MPDEVRDLARAQTRRAIERLTQWMESENAKASVSACSALLDRGWGKAPQTLNLDGVATVPLFTVGVMPSVSPDDKECG